MVYNVRVFGVIVWIEWTPSKARALGEKIAWQRLGYEARLLERFES